MKNDHCSIFVHSIAFVFGSLSNIVLAIECIFFLFVVSFTSDMLYARAPAIIALHIFLSLASRHFYHKSPAAFLSLIGKGHDIDKTSLGNKNTKNA